MSISKVLHKKQNRKNSLLYGLQAILSDGLDIFISIYLLLLIAVMPFYFTDGYYRIGTNKYEFFYSVTVVTAVIIIPVLVIYLLLSMYLRFVVEGSRESVLEDLSITDYFAAGYAVVVILSYLGSDFKEMGRYGSALQGVTGWFMGLISQLAFVGIYFAVSRLWHCRKWMPALWLPVTTVVFALGYMNRFGFRPIEMINATREYISTIGNMNWYCCYAVTVFFAILYFTWADKKKNIIVHSFLLVWMVLGFATLITQGSLSGMVTVAVMMVILYLLSMKQGETLEAFWQYCLCLGIACVVTYLFRGVFPGKFNYQDVLTNLVTCSPLAVVLLIIAAFGWLAVKILRKKEKLPIRFFTLLGYGGCIAAGVAAVVFLLLLIINTVLPGSIGVLSELPVFTFDLDWGSNRGATWKAGFMCFAGQDIRGKLFGVGPDSMVMYIQSGVDKELFDMVLKAFPKLYLTNTHNEWLTILVNEGLLGVIAYAGMIVSAIVRYLKEGKHSAWIGACGFGILAYTINNMFSFQQAMATSTMFILLGMGEAFLREKIRNKGNYSFHHLLIQK